MTEQEKIEAAKAEPGHISGPDGRAKVAELVTDARISMMTTMTADGRHVSRPMALQQVEFDGDLWFFAYDDSNKATEIHANAAGNLSFSNPGSTEWTSISGTAEIVHDRAKAEELWNPLLMTWFPEGLDTPGACLIKVHADSAEYWEGPNSRVVNLFNLVKAAVRRDPRKFSGVDNKEVDL